MPSQSTDGAAVTARLHRLVREAMARAGAAGTVVVAVSGGPDSLSLLYALHHLREELGLRLHGAHLDHGIRGPDSSADAEFVGETFRQLGIQGTLRKVDVPSFAERRRLSMEEAARELRLDFLAEVARRQRAWGVALGHTSDDQAETVLMRILRGAGTRGLRGMRPLAVRAAPGGEVILLRPLLDVTRRETEAYCREMGLRPRRDESNLSPKMTRNRVRMELLPLMERYNPAVREALLRLSRSAAEDADYLDAAAGPLWDELARRDGPAISLDREGMSSLHAAMAATLLRRAVLEVKGDLRDVTRRHVDAMMRLLVGPAGRSLDLPAGLSFSVGYSRATLLPKGGVPTPLPPLDGPREIAVPGETALAGWTVTARVLDVEPPSGPTAALAGALAREHTAYLGRDGVGLRLWVRPRRDGDRFHPLGMPQSKKLQDFMVDSKIPRSWRDRVPLLVAPKGIAWVVGWRIAEWAKVRDSDPRRLQVRFRRT